MNELDAYDYELPPELIAQHPTPQRADARLLVVHRQSGGLDHRFVRDLPELLEPGDCLVLNETQVVPARLLGRRASTGGRWEGLFLSSNPSGHWQLLGKSRSRLNPGEVIELFDQQGKPAVELELATRLDGGVWVARPRSSDTTLAILARIGRVPLPCYIRRGQMEEPDWQRYQTVYARVPGSAAAPTAGLHFSGDLLARCQRRGVELAKVVLHVGLDTFRPIAVSRLADHVMHAEWCQMTAETAETLRTARRRGGRVLAVGTTSVRVLETAAASGDFQPYEGETRLFIQPPYAFGGVDALLTNFHLPRSTLLVLVSCFAGAELTRRAYAEAIAERYRFYSYGDAMLIL